MLSYFGRFQQRGGVVVDVAVDEQEAVEGTDAGQNARDGTRTDADVVECPREAVQIVELHGFGGKLFFAEKVEKSLHVVRIGIAGVVGQSSLKQQVGAVFCQHGRIGMAEVKNILAPGGGFPPPLQKTYFLLTDR